MGVWYRERCGIEMGIGIEGMSTEGSGCQPRGVCLSGGVCLGGVCLGGVYPGGVYLDTPKQTSPTRWPLPRSVCMHPTEMHSCLPI